MEGILNSMLALEKIKRPDNEDYIVYTYVLTPKDNQSEQSSNTSNKPNATPVAYFIPLCIASSREKATEKAEEIIT